MRFIFSFSDISNIENKNKENHLMQRFFTDFAAKIVKEKLISTKAGKRKEVKIYVLENGSGKKKCKGK